MRLSRIGIRSWDLPLTCPIRVGGRTLERRAGLLVVVDDGEGHVGIGETAPLPGLHTESAEEAAAQLLAIAGQLEGATIPEGCAALDGAFESWLGDRGLHPSVRTGIEGAVLTLLADRSGKDLPHLLATAPAAWVRINGLLDDEPAAILENAARLEKSGYTALKIKVGRRGERDEAQLVAAVRARVGPAVALRLDANRAWDLATARDFAARVAPSGIEYLEEPLRDAGDLAAFTANSPVPVALDETLLGFSPQAPPPLRGVAALILKASVLGGYERSLAWARLARREGRAAVVSAAFPSAVGMALDIACASALGDETAHGLGTSSTFAEDLWCAPLTIDGGRIDARRLPCRPGDFDLGRTRVLR
jgi:isochorismate synthase/2-succinyl-5-enolpyruvyl-6-hydroxy-3-cyclohexene-1-carboxylate synthase/2-succinyl-6-hydroxy-2,4-cyclohexadiene-1-carboxylate synthase/O-succinylbenzoate synthase